MLTAGCMPLARTDFCRRETIRVTGSFRPIKNGPERPDRRVFRDSAPPTTRRTARNRHTPPHDAARRAATGRPPGGGRRSSTPPPRHTAGKSPETDCSRTLRPACNAAGCAAPAGRRMPDTPTRSGCGTGSGASMPCGPGRRDNRRPEAPAIRPMRSARISGIPFASTQNRQGQRRREKEHEHQIADPQGSCHADGDPCPGTGLPGRMERPFVVPVIPVGVHLGGVDDGRYTEGQAAENRGQDGPHQKIVRFFPGNLSVGRLGPVGSRFGIDNFHNRFGLYFRGTRTCPAVLSSLFGAASPFPACGSVAREP